MKWQHYYRASGAEAFQALWKVQGVEGTLYVLGRGFDPRVTRGLSLLADVAEAPVDVLRIGLSEGSFDPATAELAKHYGRLVESTAEATGGTVIEEPWPQVESRRSAGRLISRAIHERGYLDVYSQIVVDISGLPRSVYYPLVRGLLQAEEIEWEGNLHVIAVDSHEVDRALVQEGAEEVAPLGGFAGPPNEGESAATVWVPVIGEGMTQQLQALYERIEPDEVVPVLPFPSTDPRRSDDLLLEHGDVLVGQFDVEARNFLYASESNPFDLYRAILDLHDRYQRALRSLGKARFVLSTHSSKLLSIGVLLGAFELGLEVMHVGPSRHGLRAGSDVGALEVHGEVTDLWLTGEPYN